MKKQGYTGTKKINTIPIPANAKPAGAMKKGKKKK